MTKTATRGIDSNWTHRNITMASTDSVSAIEQRDDEGGDSVASDGAGMASPEGVCDVVINTTNSDGDLPSDCAKMDSSLIQWLRTFPDLADVVVQGDGEHGVDSDVSADIFGQKNVALAMLGVVKEMYGEESTDDNDTDAGSNDDSDGDVAVEDLWQQILTTTGIGNSDTADGGLLLQKIVQNKDPVSIESFLSTLLCRAVAADCPMQKTYIGRIMQLGSDLQMSLMKIISEKNSSSSAGGEGGDGGDDDGTIDGASVASVVESILSMSRNRGRDDQSPMSRSGYTPQPKKRFTGAAMSTGDNKKHQHPMSAVKMHRNVNEEIFSPVGSVFSPAAAAMTAAAAVAAEKAEDNDDESEDTSTLNSCARRSLGETLSYDQSVTNKKELQELKEKLEFVSGELKVSRQRETELGTQLENIESKHRAEKMKIEADSISREKDISDGFAEEIDSLRREVEELRVCRKEAHDAKEELESFRDEIDVLNHTKQRLASTEEQLRKCKEKIEEMGDTKDALVRTEEAHGAAVARTLELENELKSLQPLRRQLEDYKTRAVDAEVKLTECQEELANLQKISSELTGINKELKQGVLIHQSETEGLRKRLIEDSESSSRGEGPSVGEGLSELNPALMAEMESLRNENARLKAFAAQREDDSVQRLEESLDDNQRLAQRYKEQFLATKNELQEAQQALRDSMLREEQLKVEIATLNNEVSSLQGQLRDEQLSNQTAMLEAEKTHQETKKNLIDQARKDLESLRTEMNSLLEEERAQGKEALAMADEEKRKIEEESSKALQSAQDDAAKRIVELEEQNALALEEAAAKAKEEKENLVAKGKGMLKNVKTKAKEELAAKEEIHEAEIKEIKEMCAQFNKEQQEYEEKATAKILQYKQKFGVANGRQRELMQEAEDLQDRIKKIEREKMTLQSDNDRFRRQLGSRFGSDSGTQKQMEMLQQEFNSVLEENKRLKKKLSEGGAAPFDVGVHFHSQPDAKAMSSSNYGVGAGIKNTSTISALRAEYEDTIQNLQDEKRELIMKNSALLSDAQAADQRSWELEEELNETKGQLTSASLQIERMERTNESFIRLASPAIATAAAANAVATQTAADTSINNSIDSYHTATHNTPTAKENIANSKVDRSSNSKLPPTSKARSLMEATQVGSATEGNPECKQS